MSKEFFEQKIQEQIDSSRKSAQEHGWDFTERDVDHHTIGDFIRATLAIDNPEDAKKFYDGYLEYWRERPDSQYTPEQIVGANIGWCFGEGMSQERIQMWASVCDASHPVFGTHKISTEALLKAGMEMGSKK